MVVPNFLVLFFLVYTYIFFLVEVFLKRELCTSLGLMYNI